MICYQRSFWGSVEQWQGQGQRSKAGRSGVEGESSVEVFWSGVVQCFVSVGDEIERDSLVDGEPMQVSQMGCHMAVAGDVQDEACRGVLYALQSFLVLGHDSCVDGVAIVQPAAYEGLGDCPCRSGGDPSVDLLKHAEGVEAGGRRRR
ncbi:hypothetical protein NDU88_002878 [Pleurodeles waltl]|uniref:Uncharacterized protein n=1 Tax=Pleurodeles waltl TaxID=8319 RepID=A0AAV7VBU2_PLEWA|nr:hypothetical protein NDU88_002878 [Pleurodeles waltl]